MPQNGFMIQIQALLQGLAQERPIFHSEADFQHALAWKLHETLPTTQLRLEFRPFPDERFYVDIWCSSTEGHVALELKYLTRAVETEIAGEKFKLKNQGAQDISRYDILKDVTRLERVAREVPRCRGIGVVLTNDPGYWTQSLRLSTIDVAFRLHEGRPISGELSWTAEAGRGTTKGRENPLSLAGTYPSAWRDYSRVTLGPTGEFRYLLFEVPDNSGC